MYRDVQGAAFLQNVILRLKEKYLKERKLLWQNQPCYLGYGCGCLYTDYIRTPQILFSNSLLCHLIIPPTEILSHYPSRVPVQHKQHTPCKSAEHHKMWGPKGLLWCTNPRVKSSAWINFEKCPQKGTHSNLYI